MEDGFVLFKMRCCGGRLVGMVVDVMVLRKIGWSSERLLQCGRMMGDGIPPVDQSLLGSCLLRDPS